MAQVAIIVNGASHPGKSEIARALGILLGCPVLDPAPIATAITQATGPVAPSDGVRALAIETVWRTAGLIEAGVVLDATFLSADAGVVEAGFALGGDPRVVEVWCGEDGAGLGLTPSVTVPDVASVDIDALVQQISALFL